ncbi:conjugative transfer signal peptidase TraF [Robbsia sp. Bb-Pol-6]|uniref:Conjugative transfer signal peptidase TraF n=1 Tax=Robbsia betulipollinis TaxID=2981849 RepID=A0ABT3ZKD6_9BURK|nr:conjugative transfer signal peptidase TraF [Robbsia betulipollinis]MCY0386745.1 conjugative transfer signal peptidase TraF [Robbsia betulipollinis]
MRRFIERVFLVSVAGGVGVMMAGGMMYYAGARVNTSKSIPRGLYWTSGEPFEKGRYVAFCPPPDPLLDTARARGYIGSGFCPGGYSYMMKTISAAKGDTVSVTSQGVTVNGELLRGSAPLAFDAIGRPLPRLHVARRTLGDADLLLMAERSATSFDARYFGIVTRDRVQSIIRPVVVW